MGGAEATGSGSRSSSENKSAGTTASAQWTVVSMHAWDEKPNVPDVNMIDMSLKSPCLAIPCLANERLMEQA